MSKNINVNPGQYKVTGRERQGESLSQNREKAKLSIKNRELRDATRPPRARKPSR
jgi:hypothetical protein